MLLIKLVKSKAGNNWRNNATVAALGLKKVGQVVQQNDTSVIRGMIHHVKHMLSVEEVPGERTTPLKRMGKKAAGTATVAAEKPKAKKAAAAKTEDAPAEEAKPKAKRTTKKATEAGE